jgi:predicted Zn-dependent protease
MIRRGTPRTLALDPTSHGASDDAKGRSVKRPVRPLHHHVIAPIQPGMVSKVQGRVAAVASVSARTGGVARRLALLALLVVGIAAHAEGLFFHFASSDPGIR